MADGTLVCTLKFSEETGRKWTQNGIDRAIMLFKTVTMLGADGAEILTASDTYVSATESTIGWATRVADMRIDNVRVLMQTAQETTGATRNRKAPAPSRRPNPTARLLLRRTSQRHPSPPPPDRRRRRRPEPKPGQLPESSRKRLTTVSPSGSWSPSCWWQSA